MAVPSPPPIRTPRLSLRVLGLCVVLVSLTAFAFWPALDAGFVDFDDDAYVTAAPWRVEGLSPETVALAFRGTVASHWQPLTALSHMLDVELYGLEPRGHHRTSVLWHLANGVLLFLLLRSLSGATWRSFLVAALFAVHPLRVESVAWIAERKDVLSTFFALLTIGAYQRYVRSPTVRAYCLVAVCFVLGLMSKAMLVTLPMVLLLLDLWPLGRLAPGLPAAAESPTLGRPGVGQGSAGGGLSWAALRRRGPRLVLEKVPLLLFSAAFGWATVATHGNALSTRVEATTGLRIANALDAYTQYLLDTLWPTGLAAYYPFPEAIPSRHTAASLLVLVAISALVVARARRAPELAVGWFWYLGTLVPVIGLLHVGHQARADRYTYLPTIGLLILVVWGGARLWARFAARGNWSATRGKEFRAEVSDPRKSPRVGPVVLGAVCGLVLLALAFATRAQVAHWHDSESLWSRALAVTENNYLAHLNLAEVLRAEGRRDEAEGHYHRVVELRPGLAVGHGALGEALRQWGRTEAAIEHLERAVELDPSDMRPRMGLASAWSSLGRSDEALGTLRAAVETRPDFAAGHLALAELLEERASRAGTAEADLAAVVESYRQALRHLPPNPAILVRLARALERAGRLDEAAAELERAIEARPEPWAAHRHLGSLRLRLGQYEAARDPLGTAFAADPQPDTALALARVLLELGDRSTARQVLGVAVERHPENEDLRRALARSSEPTPAVDPPEGGSNDPEPQAEGTTIPRLQYQ